MFADVSDDLNVRARLTLEFNFHLVEFPGDETEDALRRKSHLLGNCGTALCLHDVAQTLVCDFPELQTD